MTATDLSDEELRRAAKERVARLFKVDPDALDFNDEFGEKALKASFVSDWKANELDVLYDDIYGAADRKTWKKLKSGALVIHTVGDYCEYMVSCYRLKPKEVIHVLFDRGK